MSSMHRAQLRR